MSLKMTFDRSKKKKQQQDEEEAERMRNALASFEDDFLGSGPSNTGPKAFIRADVVNAGKSVGSTNKSALYKPEPTISTFNKPKLPSTAGSFEEAKRLAAEKARRMLEEAHKGKPAPVVVAPSTAKPMVRPPRPGALNSQAKSKTSNLDAFKEELKRVQEERDKRKGIRQQLTDTLGLEGSALDKIVPNLDTPFLGGSAEHDLDPFTTNVYICNLPLTVEMQDILDTFGSFGPLASAKILFPRTDEEKRRDHLCGFVAYMNRADADRALTQLIGLEIQMEPIKFSFAKRVAIPAQPFYVPPPLQALVVPDPPTGLPFNAKPLIEDAESFHKKYGDFPPLGGVGPDPEDRELFEDYEKMIKNATVRVVIPTDSHLLSAMHRVIEFVLREGPVFEAMFMGREAGNPMFRFMYDMHHPAHVYYRWKLFSLAQGDSLNKWRMQKFRMFENGSWWQPPQLPGDILKEMPPELYYTSCNRMEPERWFPVKIKPSERDRERERQQTRKRGRNGSDDEDEKTKEKPKKKNYLGRKERDELEQMLRQLTPEKDKIGDAMVWCLEHATCSKEIVECIYEAISVDSTQLHKRIARVYLVVDILANSAQRGVKDAFYFRQFFGEIFEKIFEALAKVLSEIESRLKAEQFKQRIMNCFRAWEDSQVYPTDMLIHCQNVFLGLVKVNKEKEIVESDEDIDGAPIDDEDIDGVPISDEPGKKDNIFDSDDDEPKEKEPPKKKPAFKAAAWNEVTETPAGARSKWDDEPAAASKWDDGKDSAHDDDEDIDGVPIEASSTSRASHGGGGGLVGYDMGDSGSDTDGEIVDEPSAILANSAIEDERRKLVREIEVKAMALQDELEGTPDAKKKVEEFRRKETRKIEEKLEARMRKRDKKEKKEKENKEKKDSKKKNSRSGSRERDRDRKPLERETKDRERDRERTERSRRSRSKSRNRDRSRERRDRRERSSERTERRRSRSRERRRDRSRSGERDRRSGRR